MWPQTLTNVISSQYKYATLPSSVGIACSEDLDQSLALSTTLHPLFAPASFSALHHWTTIPRAL